MMVTLPAGTASLSGGRGQKCQGISNDYWAEWANRCERQKHKTIAFAALCLCAEFDFWFLHTPLSDWSILLNVIIGLSILSRDHKLLSGFVGSGPNHRNITIWDYLDLMAVLMHYIL